MSSDADRPDSEGHSQSAPIDRRSFNAAVGAGAVGTALHQLLGAPASAAQAARQGASELCEMTAVDLVGRLRKKEVSAREVMSAHLTQIEHVNSKVNAIVTLVAEQAMANAARADDTLARGGAVGVLHGLPVAHKDLVDTAGIRTTRGSQFYRDNIPSHDALIVTRIRAAGAITVGKTNTPELGAGSQTFNAVFGATRNPYDLTKTCGGSSGGAATALACRMLPIADGSDTGGSLRNPAAFCNVVGLRPSPGRVASESTSWSPLAVSGPIARTVADVALFLSAIAGSDPRCPLSIQEDGARFRGPLEKNLKGARVAWWRGLGGIPFEPEIRRVVDGNRKVFEDMGCVVEEAEPDFNGPGRSVSPASLHLELRAVCAAGPAAPRVGQGHDQVRGRAGRTRNRRGSRPRAGRDRRACSTRAGSSSRGTSTSSFRLHRCEPFDVNVPYPTEIAGTTMTTYIDWMRSCWYVTMMSNPAISVPAGFTSSGLPVGLQIVGRHRDEWSVLQLAHAFEQATLHWKRRPAGTGRGRLNRGALHRLPKFACLIAANRAARITPGAERVLRS